VKPNINSVEAHPQQMKPLQTSLNKGCVTHCGLAIYIKKYLKAKEELWKLKYISPCKNIIFKKILKKNQNPSDYNSITNLKF
jgi:hypothetical protein